MKRKYYVVRKGRVPGIYESWKEAEKHVKGFPGAEYKSFEKIENAKAYLEGKDECSCPKFDEETMIAYVDGSYDVVCGSGVVLCYRGKKEEYYFWTDIDEFKNSKNIAGEIMAALFAMDYALKQRAKKLILKHDLEGLEKWAKGEYRTKELVTRVYKYYYELFRGKGLEVIFEKVKGHSGDFCNDEADRLAKRAARGEKNIEWTFTDSESIIEILRKKGDDLHEKG
ncbi:viroplasmin family protein [Thermotoga sp. SG1]|uniref:ribonuclease H1 domain-containing protein n=1 Tax=Thermotoga sp. SG1 TaxID=126739 RepID=UPI000CC8A137|nr:viroplasmin family protein [Thermotoga sp. SG1]PLV56325.1 ribonuclease H [Thermotoga sp. SG1]